MFTPQSLQFDSPLATRVFQAEEVPEARAVEEAQLLAEIAMDDLNQAQAAVVRAQEDLSEAQGPLQTANDAVAAAQTALDAEPDNPSLIANLDAALAAQADALAAVNDAQAILDAAVHQSTVADEVVVQMQADLDAAEDAYNALEQAYLDNQILIGNDRGTALQRIEILRPHGVTIGYQAPSESGNSFWRPEGKERYYTSRIQAKGNGGFARVNGQGQEFQFNQGGGNPVYRGAAGRTIALDSPGVKQDVVRSEGVLRQILTSQSICDIVVESELAYSVLLYPRDAVTGVEDGIYQIDPNAVSFASFRVENPTGDPNQLGHVRITKTQGNKTIVRNWVYSENTHGWTYSVGEGSDLAYEERTSTQISETEEVNQWEVRNAQHELVSRRNETLKDFAWGAMIVRGVLDPGGSNLEETFEYYSSEADGASYGKLRLQTFADGAWLHLTYDDEGRVATRVEPWLDSPVGSAPEAARTTYLSYEPVDSRDSLLEYDRRVRNERVEILGQEISRTYFAYFVNASGQYVEIEERVATPGAAYGASGNLRTTRVYYPESDPEATAGRLLTEAFPDGRLDTYSYERQADGSLITTVTHGVAESPDGIAQRTTREIITLDPVGNETRRETLVYTGVDYETVGVVTSTFDDLGLLTHRSRDGRTIYTGEYEDGQVQRETDESGVTTEYTYDSRGRTHTSTRVGRGGQADVVTTYGYDAYGRMVRRVIATVEWPLDLPDGVGVDDSGPMTDERWTYDLAGRMTSHTDTKGLTTTYAYEDGGRVIIRTNPDTSVVRTERFLDGQRRSVTGTGVVDEFCDYNVYSDGSVSKATVTGRADSPRRIVSVNDMLGRVVEETVPGYGDGHEIVRSFHYNDRGLLTRRSETGRADTLIEYDAARKPLRSGLDLDLSPVNTLELSSEDRISEEDTYFAQDGPGHWWRITQERVYADPLSDAATVSQTRRERLTGFAPGQATETSVEDAHGNATVTSVLIDRDEATLTRIITYPDSVHAAVVVEVNGRLVSQSNRSIPTPTTFLYDDLGRLVERRNPRHPEAETWQYHTALDRLESHTDAAGNMTSFRYYGQGELGAGRIAAITNALNHVERRGYDLRGELIHVWGDASYPVAFTFNEFGERTGGHFEKPQSFNPDVIIPVYAHTQG